VLLELNPGSAPVPTEIRPVFHGGQFRIFGDLLLFLAEVVEFDLLSLGRVGSIYFNKKMSKGLMIELWIHAPQGIHCNFLDDFPEIKIVSAGFLC
jgi:hypothetical protein